MDVWTLALNTYPREICDFRPWLQLVCRLFYCAFHFNLGVSLTLLLLVIVFGFMVEDFFPRVCSQSCAESWIAAIHVFGMLYVSRIIFLNTITIHSDLNSQWFLFFIGIWTYELATWIFHCLFKVKVSKVEFIVFYKLNFLLNFII